MKSLFFFVGLCGISSVFVCAADSPSAMTPVLQSLVDDQIVPGIVTLVVDRDGVLALDKAGYTSLAQKTPMREDAVFWIASMSKPLTGAALMMLVEAGKVSLDDPVEKFLPEFKGQMIAGPDGAETPHPPQHPITVRQLMCHTSGMVLANDKTLKRTHALKDDVALSAERPLRQEPGSKYEYNNCGINTAGRIIEVVSGQTYDDFMRTRLFEPLGMKDTTCWPNEEQASRLARSAKLTEDRKSLVEVDLDKQVTPEAIAKFSEGVPVPRAVISEMGFGIAFEYGKRYAMPAGGYFSTAHDLGRFCRMLLRGGELDGKRYLSEHSVRVMTESHLGQAKLSDHDGYGIGWSVKLKDDQSLAAGSYGHLGARRTAMWIDPKNGLAVVILVEHFDMPGEQQKIMYGGVMKTAINTFRAKPAGPEPTVANVSFGSHPHQLIDLYLPKQGAAPYPSLLWFGGIWKAAKHPANLGYFNSRGIAVIAVQTRTMEDAVAEGEKVPISYVQNDAVRVVQFVRRHAAQWNLDPAHLAVGGGSQGAQPALFVGCARDQANPASGDPVERESSLVTCVAAYRCQPTLDPVRMQEWVAGVKWGAPALGVSFEESLKRRDELLPLIKQWSPDYLLHQDAAPMFFENEWGMVKPDDITQNNYDVHSPAWAVGFQKLALEANARCYVKYPGHPADEIAKDIWDFVASRLRP